MIGVAPLRRRGSGRRRSWPKHDAWDGSRGTARAGNRGTPRAARAGQTVRLHPQTVRLTVRLSLTWGFAGQRPRLPGRADGACHLPALGGVTGVPPGREAAEAGAVHGAKSDGECELRIWEGAGQAHSVAACVIPDVAETIGLLRLLAGSGTAGIGRRGSHEIRDFATVFGRLAKVLGFRQLERDRTTTKTLPGPRLSRYFT